MNKAYLAEQLKKAAEAGTVLTDEPMSRHTTFRIGGPADFYVCPSGRQELIDTVSVCRNLEVPCYVIGNGSNLLVSDRGYRGVIIEAGHGMAAVENTENSKNVLRAEAGILLAALSHRAAELHLAGLEFASGIPGTLGGAVYMNAGAYGGEMAQVISKADVLTMDGHVETLTNEELAFGYRHSAVIDRGLVVLGAELILKDGDPEAIKELMADLRERRQSKQPLEYPSAGSTFKRPEGCFAGKLIMDAGLAGYAVGGAEVSAKHCGFVINRGRASADDVRRLIDHVIKTVEAASGITLEPEVRFLGES